MVPKAARAGAAAAILTAGTLLPIGTKSAFAENISQIPSDVSVMKLDQNDKLSDLLDDDQTRAVLVAGLGLTIAATVNSYLLGEKYDDKKKRLLRMAGPAVSTLAAASLLTDSLETISADIPAGLILGSSLFFAAHNIVDTFEHHVDPKIRSSALAAAGFMTTVGLTAFVALSNRV